MSRRWGKRLGSLPPVVVAVLATVASLAPFVGKAVHADDPLFVWAARHIQMRGDMMFSASGMLATMGNALPYAIGAAVAYPGRQVVAVLDRLGCNAGACHGSFRGQAIFLAKVTAAKDGNPQSGIIIGSDEAIANHSASAGAEFRVPGNFDG